MAAPDKGPLTRRHVVGAAGTGLAATQEKLEKFGGMTSLGRPGQPAELASIYVQLAADDASFATGQIYGASGGTGQP